MQWIAIVLVRQRPKKNEKTKFRILKPLSVAGENVRVLSFKRRTDHDRNFFGAPEIPWAFSVDTL
jgi:hypothetical protein